MKLYSIIGDDVVIVYEVYVNATNPILLDVVLMTRITFSEWLHSPLIYILNGI